MSSPMVGNFVLWIRTHIGSPQPTVSTVTAKEMYDPFFSLHGTIDNLQLLRPKHYMFIA